MHRSPRGVPGLLAALTTVLVFAAHAEDQGNAKSAAYRSSVAQDTLRQDAATAQAGLAAIREEMRDFLPDDLALVDRAFNKLESLSHNEMTKAVEDLRNASKAGDIRHQMESLAGAQQEQAIVSEGLMKMSVDLNARQTSEKLAARIEDLMQRQSNASNEMVRLAAVNPVATQLRDHNKTRYGAVVADQETISSNIGALVETLDALGKNLPDGPTRGPLTKVISLASERQLAISGSGVLQAVRQGPLDQAGTMQRAVADTLLAMRDVLKSANSTLGERLGEIAKDIKAVADGQKDIADSKELEKKPVNLVERQKELADKVAVLTPQLKGINDRAAESLEKAKADMESAQKAMAGSREEKKALAETVKSAEALLATAQAAVEQQVAQADKAPATPEELAAQLSQLQAATAQAAQEQLRQATAASQPPTPQSPTAAQKEALQKKVQQLQDQAAAPAPDAAKSLGAAATKMGQADPASQKEAAQSLAKASQQLGEQLAALTGQTPAQQAMAKAESQIQQASQTTAQAQSNVAPGSQKSAEAVNQLGTARQQVAAAQQAANASGVPAAAQQALGQAQQALEKAQMSAAQVKLGDAQAQAAAAQQALSQAQSSLAQANQAMQGQAMGPLVQGPLKNSSQPGGVASGPAMMAGGGEQTASPGSSAGAQGPSQVVTGLNPKDRAAVTQLQGEKPPSEFVPEVQQYYKNLADGVGL